MTDKDPALAELAQADGLELDWTDEAGRVAVDSDTDAHVLILAPDERALLDALRSTFATAIREATWEAQVAADAIGRLGRLRARLIATIVERDQAPTVELAATLEDVRAALRTELLRLGAAIDDAAGDGIEPEVLTAVVDAYRGLGGDLELAEPRPDELTAAARRLAVATRELAAEDFPDRIRHVVPAINDVVNEALR